MNETASPTPYINTFLTERPKDGIDLMQARLRSALKLNDDLAEYFRERALIEDLYAKNLAKLNKKPFISDKSALGTLLPAWERIQNELLDTSNIHATFATKMINDIEKSLRSAIPNDQAYAEVRSMDPTFQKLAKDYDDRLSKMTKHRKILDKSGKKPSDTEAKYADIKKHFEATRSEWQQYSSKYIQLFQSVDEHHWYDIKNFLLQFETLQTDQMLKRVQLAGDNLASVSDFSIENEILSFCRQHTKTNELSTKSIPSAAHPPVTTMPSSSSIQPTFPEHESNVIEPTSPVHSSSAVPTLLVDTSDHPIEPRSTKSTESYASNLTTTTGTPSSHFSSVAENVHHCQPELHVQRRQNTPSIKSKKSDKQRKFLSSISIRLKPKSSNNSQFGHQLPDLPETTDAQLSPVKSSTFADNASVYSSHDDPSSITTYETNNQTPSSPNTLSPPTLRKTSSFADSFFGAHSSSPHQQNSTPNILVDEEGFSIPPPDRTPWAAASTTSPTSPTNTLTSGDDQQDAGDVVSLDNSSLFGTTSRIKLDIKNDSVIQEDANTSQVALTRVASMLKESNPMASKRPRGRRELRSQLLQGNTLSIYQTSSTSSPLSMSATLENNNTTLLPPGNDNTNTTLLPPDNDDHHPPKDDSNITPDQTLHSPFDDDLGASRPMTTSPSAPQTTMLDESAAAIMDNEPKLNVQITETIHAQIQQGEIHRMVVTGEVALLYEGAHDDPPVEFVIQHNGTETTHLADNIKRLENEEGVDSDNVIYQFIPNSSNTNDYIACLHYRQQSPDLVAPLLVKPMWKCDPEQARLIIKYSSNNDVLDQVMMMTQVGGDCYGAQSMPTGQWMVDQQRMVWSLGNSVTPQEQVIRAKFSTTSLANMRQPIAVRFEIKNQLVSKIQVTSRSGQRHPSRRWATINQVERHTRSGKYMAEV